MIDRKELKSNARAAMGETRPHPFWVTLGLTVLLLVVQVLSLSLNGSLDAYRTMYENARQGVFEYVMASGSTGLFPWLLNLALDLMSMVLGVGYALYTLRLSRRQGPGFGDVFDAFGLFLRAVAVSVLKALLIFAWSLIFLLPAYLLVVFALMGGAGVMDGDVTGALLNGRGWVIVLMIAALTLETVGMLLASYRYRLAEFILLDHPEFSAGQCLTMSRLAMKGRKAELFRLDLSFLGWFLLSVVPFVGMWVRPYHGAAVAEWYDRRYPAFMEEMQERWRQRQTRSPGPGNPGGWSVPRQDGDESDDPDGRWM